MRSTESDSREWYVEKLWIVPALALLLPPLAFLLTFSRLILLGVFLPLLITLVVGIVVLLIVLVLRINGVKEQSIRLATWLAVADIIAGIFAIYLMAVSR